MMTAGDTLSRAERQAHRTGNLVTAALRAGDLLDKKYSALELAMMRFESVMHAHALAAQNERATAEQVEAAEAMDAFLGGVLAGWDALTDRMERVA
jgi:hypothetical protein